MSPRHRPPGSPEGGQFMPAGARPETNQIALNDRDEWHSAGYGAHDQRDYPDAGDLAEIEAENRADARRAAREEAARRAAMTQSERDAEDEANRQAWKRVQDELENGPEPPW